jgi:aspartate kinase
VVGVASERDVLVLDAEGVADELFAVLDEHAVAGKQLHRAGRSLTMVVSRENLHDEGKLRAELAKRFGDRVRLVGTLGAVSVVGAGINATFANLRHGTEALAGGGIIADQVATSSFRITWMLDRARIDDAVRLLHQTFIP